MFRRLATFLVFSGTLLTVRWGWSGGEQDLPLTLASHPALPGASESTSESARYSFEYRVIVPSSEKPGERLSLWIPYPAEDEYQKVLRSEVISPFTWEIRTEKKFKNRVVYIQGTTRSEPVELILRYEVERKLSRGYPKELVRRDELLNPSRYLSGDRLVPLNRQIREIAQDVTQGVRDPSEKIRAIYRWIYDTMTYNKDGAGWGQGDAVWACHNKRGNCTDFHSLLIAMARSQNIPARFVIGFPIPTDAKEGTIPGYHCWAEVFDPKEGWIPVDASEAKKLGRPPEEYFGRLPVNRIQFSLGRDLILDPPQKGEPLNYFIYPYAERNGKEWKELKKEFRFERLS